MIKNRPIIFLDIDGVLAPFCKPGEYIYVCKDLFSHGCLQFDTACVTRFNKLVSELGATVVISSSWRYMMEIDLMRKMFYAQGCICDIAGYTPNGHSRTDEINQYLNEIGPVDFVVIDDMDLVIENFVRTNSYLGLQDKDVEAIHQMLAGRLVTRADSHDRNRNKML